MTPLRVSLFLAGLVLVSTGSLSAWIYSHHRYGYAVYYEALSVTTSMAPNAPQRKDLWVDPRHGLRLQLSGSGEDRTGFLIQDAGRVTYQFNGSVASPGAPLTDPEAQAFQLENALLDRGGFRGLAEGRLAHAVGPIARVRFNGRPALRFETGMHSPYVQHLMVWIDARTHAPLQLQVQYPGYTYTQTVIRASLIRPGSLPDGFFEPPRPDGTLWTAALSWVRDRLGISH